MSSILSLLPLGLLTFAPIASGSPAGSPPKQNTAKECVELQVPVPVVATNIHYDQPRRVDNTVDAIQWEIDVATWSSPKWPERARNNVTINTTFNINAKLCVPTKKGPKSDTLQIATAGLGFDKRYWDVEVDPASYSYVDAAIAQGYSILTYDRLGTGKSEKPNAYEVVQIPTETALLASLTNIARSGRLLSSSKILTPKSNIAKNYTPTKIIQLGHAYGSALVAAVLINNGSALSDGALLTGYILSSKSDSLPLNIAYFDHEFAREHDPKRFGEYGSGYFVLTTESDLQKLFLRGGTFEPKLLKYMESVKQPETVGEYASEGTAAILGVPATEFKGPIQFFTGDFDFVTCGGDCRGTILENVTQSLFPASKIGYHLQPDTAHAMTFSKNASAGYNIMFDFLKDNGL